MKKKDAAKFLGVSIRALERYTHQGKISVRYEQGKTRPVAVYDQKELEEFKQALQTSLYPQRPAVKPEKLANTAHTLAKQAELPELSAGTSALIAALKSLGNDSRSKVAIEHKLLLNLNEAQALTGLSRAHLRDAIEAGKLGAQIIGRAWRIKRADLERYIKKL